MSDTDHRQGHRPVDCDADRTDARLAERLAEKVRRAEAESKIPIDKLLRAVEGELIPRLMMSHLVDVPGSLVGKTPAEGRGDPVWASASQIEDFSQHCVDGNATIIRNRVNVLIEQGFGIEAIYVKLLAPVANRLGDRWLEDSLSFIDVHTGLLRMHQLIASLEFVGPVQKFKSGRSILFASTPGDQHTFSTTLVADLFKRAGWDVANQSGQSEQVLLSAIKSNRYEWIGLSLHNSTSYPRLKRLIQQIRTLPERPFIVIGGDYFNRCPEDIQPLGADLCVIDGERAVETVTDYMATARHSAEV